MVDEDTMELWNSVCNTDPLITKHVTQRGGFTAICAQAQKKRATEIWGPYGTFWGLRDLHWILVGKVDEVPQEIVLEAVFYYPGGEFEIASDAKYKAGDDCRKKLRTDCLTKALSDLGFNSDVFEGKFDDSKYVEQMESEFTNSAPPQNGKSKTEELDKSWHAGASFVVGNCQSVEEITPIANKTGAYLDCGMINQLTFDAVIDICRTKRLFLEKAMK